MDGVYVKGSICDIDVVYTVDTGASISLLSDRIYQEIKKQHRPQLDEKTPLMTNANGKPITCRGCGIFPILFGPVYMEKQLIVANITDDVLLGADILLGDPDGPADLLFSKKVIQFRGAEIQIEADGYPKKQIRKVHLADNYTIPE